MIQLLLIEELKPDKDIITLVLCSRKSNLLSGKTFFLSKIFESPKSHKKLHRHTKSCTGLFFSDYHRF